jgi:hypothetical protein
MNNFLLITLRNIIIAAIDKLKQYIFIIYEEKRFKCR